MELSPRLYSVFVRPKFISCYLYQKALENSYNFNNKTVLDFGCGIGTCSETFPKSNYIGVDCDDKRIYYAKQKYPNSKFIVIQDGHRLPIPDQSVDFIIIFSVLHHIPNERIIDIIKDFQRIIKSDGKLIIVEPCFKYKRSISNIFMSIMDKGEYIRTENGYKKLFYQSQFKTKVVKNYKQLLLYHKLFMIAKLK